MIILSDKWGGISEYNYTIQSNVSIAMKKNAFPLDVTGSWNKKSWSTSYSSITQKRKTTLNHFNVTLYPKLRDAINLLLHFMLAIYVENTTHSNLVYIYIATFID